MPESHLDRTIRWMSHDVKICMAHDAYVGAMTLMLAHTAALSGYFAGRTQERPDNDELEFMTFYNRYFKIFPDIKSPVEHGKRKSMIYSDFRNGLIHEHLMKKGTGLDKGLTKPPFYIETRSSLVVLNVDHFFVDYLRVLAEYSGDVKKDGENEIQKKFRDRAIFLGASEPIV